MSRRVIVLDRDGTLNVDTGYVARPGDVTLLPGVVDGLRDLASGGFEFVVVSNQSGVGRGYFSLQDLDAVNHRLESLLRDASISLLRIYCCVHRPDEGCDCRKPGPALMEEAAREFGFDPASAIVIGDKPSDVAFGRRFGARTVRLDGTGGLDLDADAVTADLRVAAKRILAEGW